MSGPSGVKLLSQTQIHPYRTPASPQSSPLSIIDASVANYGLASAVWFFPPPSHPYTYSIPNLTLSLQHTLSSYPQWTGHLQMYPFDQSLEADHTKCFGRPWIHWGTDDDPGLELVIASSEMDMVSFLPAVVQTGVYDMQKTASQDFLPPSDTMVKIHQPPSGLRAIAVKITYFACGGIAIGIALNHTLADAQTLSLFMSDWGTVHRDLIVGKDPAVTLPDRPFDPPLLDKYAAGDIDGMEDPELRAVALSLPQIRLDWWASSDGKPDMISSPTEPDPLVRYLDVQSGSNRGEKIPWDTWDHTKPVKDYIFDFTPDDIEAIWLSTNDSGVSLSRLDTLQAWLWKLVVKARQLRPDTLTFMDMSLGLRSRLDPPLPPTFLGSPIVNFSASAPVSILASQTVADVATTIRSAVSQFNAETIPALLHHLAHSIDPIRFWNAFMGDHHLMTTSWLGIGAYDKVNFGDSAPVHVAAGMWPIDGLVVLMDRPVPEGSPIVSGAGHEKWYERGVSVRLFLKADTMDRLLLDPDLWNRS